MGWAAERGEGSDGTVQLGGWEQAVGPRLSASTGSDGKSVQLGGVGERRWVLGCRPPLSVGQNRGSADEQKRGLPLWECVATVHATRPRGFIIENVTGLAHRHKQHLCTLVKLLSNSGPVGYNVDYRILNSRHFGLPHHRERVFIVGQRRDAIFKAFEWPQEGPLSSDLGRIILPRSQVSPLTKSDNWSSNMQYHIEEGTKLLRKKGVDPSIVECCINIRNVRARVHATAGYSPCLTRDRAGFGGFYLTRQKRMMDLKELVRLQGFADDQWDLEALCLIDRGVDFWGPPYGLNLLRNRDVLLEAASRRA